MLVLSEIQLVRAPGQVIFLPLPLSYEPILALLLYTDLYVIIFKILNFLGWQNIEGAIAPPPPPYSYGFVISKGRRPQLIFNTFII